STTLTALLGGWRITWGPIWTLANGFQDAIGGEQQRARNEALAWHNVVAFIQARQIPIAYGLAEKLLRTENKDLQTPASYFTALCRSHGFKPQGELKDPWSEVRSQSPLRMAVLAALPLALLGWILVETRPNASRSYSYPSDAVEPSAIAYDVGEVPGSSVV